MKTLTTFLSSNPSYVKCGNQKISDYTGISTTTIARFKKTKFFKELNRSYRNKN